MKCPICKAVIKNPISVKGGKKGGLAKVKKGFACEHVLKKALRTRRRNRMARIMERQKEFQARRRNVHWK